MFRVDGDRVDDHAALRAFHAIDFFGLPVDRHVAVNEADAALLRQRDGQVRFGDRVHGRADDGNVQRDVAREPGPCVGLCRDDVAARRHQQNVVKCEAFRDRFRNHAVYF